MLIMDAPMRLIFLLCLFASYTQVAPLSLCNNLPYLQQYNSLLYNPSLVPDFESLLAAAKCLPPMCGELAKPEPQIDAVSLALALQAQKECIREEKLHFGPNRLPLDGRIIKCPRFIPEGGLYTLNRNIVELKPQCPKKTLAEEAAESYIDDEIDCCWDACNKPCLTYYDVGYCPEKPKCPEFVPGAPPNSCPVGTVVYSGPVQKCLPQCTPSCTPCSPSCVPNCPDCSSSCLSNCGCQQSCCNQQPCIPCPTPNPCQCGCCPPPTAPCQCGCCSPPTAPCQCGCCSPPTAPCQQCESCQCSSTCPCQQSYQPGGLYITQNGCRNAACTPEYSPF